MKKGRTEDLPDDIPTSEDNACFLQRENERYHSFRVNQQGNDKTHVGLTMQILCLEGASSELVSRCHAWRITGRGQGSEELRRVSLL
jgi:hypothetical protein